MFIKKGRRKYKKRRRRSGRKQKPIAVHPTGQPVPPRPEPVQPYQGTTVFPVPGLPKKAMCNDWPPMSGRLSLLRCRLKSTSKKSIVLPRKGTFTRSKNPRWSNFFWGGSSFCFRYPLRKAPRQGEQHVIKRLTPIPYPTRLPQGGRLYKE